MQQQEAQKIKCAKLSLHNHHVQGTQRWTNSIVCLEQDKKQISLRNLKSLRSTREVMNEPLLHYPHNEQSGTRCTRALRRHLWSRVLWKSRELNFFSLQFGFLSKVNDMLENVSFTPDLFILYISSKLDLKPSTSIRKIISYLSQKFQNL